MSTFYKILRPLFMALPPEAAHSLSLKFVPLLPKAGAPDPILQTTAAGLAFKSPIGLAAGYDKDAVATERLFRLGFGLVEAGTLTPKAQPGNPKPRIFRLAKDRAVINRLGFNNQGFEAALGRLKARSGSKKPGILGINIGANKGTADPVSDYLAGIAAFSGVADYFTVNISSPNTPGLRDLQTRENLETLVKDLTAALKEAKASPPLFIKIAPDLEPGQLEDIVAISLKYKIAGLVISNTTLARPEALVSKNRNQAGGLSGKPLFEPSTALLRRAFTLSKGRLTLIGVGGVSSAEDAFGKILNGANLVQLYTGLIFEGPGLVKDINSGLAALLRAKGYANVTQAVGRAVKN